MYRLSIFLSLVLTIISTSTINAKNNDEFNITKIYLEIIENSNSLQPLPSPKIAIAQLGSQPFSLSSVPDMKNKYQKYKYFNTLGYYTALGVQNPEGAVVWLPHLSKLTNVGQKGMITAIHNIGPPSKNKALEMLLHQAPKLRTRLNRMPRNVLEFPAITTEIMITLNGAFYATGSPKYTALMIKGLKESLPTGRRPNALLSHLIPYFLQMQSLMHPIALQTIKFSETLPQLKEIAPLLLAIANKTLIAPEAGLAAMSKTDDLNLFFGRMSKIVAEIALKGMSDSSETLQ